MGGDELVAIASAFYDETRSPMKMPSAVSKIELFYFEMALNAIADHQ